MQTDKTLLHITTLFYEPIHTVLVIFIYKKNNLNSPKSNTISVYLYYNNYSLRLKLETFIKLTIPYILLSLKSLRMEDKQLCTLLTIWAS